MAIRVIDDSKLQNIAVAIQGKDGGGKMTVDEMPGRIQAIPTGGTTVKKAVNFYTFKGLAYSYTAEEAVALTEMPEPPTIERFTFQKWNGWTVEKIKTWLENHDSGELSVGGLYATTDGHTRINMHLREAKLASLEMPFCIQQMAGTVVIDWGDGSTPETITAAGVYSHTWQVNQYPADVVIDIEYIPSGSTKLVLGRAVGTTSYGLFNNETYYASCVETVELGNNVDFLTYTATFTNCTHLREINLPDGITSIERAFQNCINLTLTVLPDGITSIGNNAFYGCTNLALTVLPDGITSIGNTAFRDCTSLALTVLPDGVTRIDGNAFYGCANLALTVLPDGVTYIGNGALQGCTNLALTALPDGVTYIGNTAFRDCTSLALTVLPDGVTRINGYAFYGCTNLALTVLPDGVTRIDSYAFYGCTHLYFIDMTKFTNPQSIPNLVNANAFQGIPAEAQFQVSSQGMYDAFTTATNWSAYASQFIVKGAN